LITSQKLRHYFETYKIVVVTEYPLGDILLNKEDYGSIIKCVVKLGTYSIESLARAQVPARVFIQDLRTPSIK
jgi:hypothetical protein